MSVLSLNSSADRIVFEVSSDKSANSLPGLEESIAEHCDSLAPDARYMTEYTIKVYAIDDDGVNVMDIGFLEGLFFESETVIAESLPFTMLCDMFDQDVYDMAEAITDKRGLVRPSICPPEYNITYVRKVYIEEQCRGFGVGQYLLNNLKALLMESLNIDPYVCILAPYPQTKTGKEDLTPDESRMKISRLVRFYEKAGFTRIEGSDFMCKHWKDALDEIFDMFRDE